MFSVSSVPWIRLAKVSRTKQTQAAYPVAVNITETIWCSLFQIQLSNNYVSHRVIRSFLRVHFPMLPQLYKWSDKREFDLSYLMCATLQNWGWSHLCYSAGDLHAHTHKYMMCMFACMEVCHMGVYICVYNFAVLQFDVSGPKTFWPKEITKLLH